MFKIIEVPGFFVHQWDVLLRDVIPMNYVSSTSFPSDFFA